MYISIPVYTLGKPLLFSLLSVLSSSPTHLCPTVAPLEFNQLVPQLRTTTLGGSITLQCPCSYDDQTWCIAGGSLSLGPMTLAPPLDGVTELNLDSASCQDNSESSIRIGNVQPFMDRAMVYCAQQCNDPLKIVGQTTILRTAGTP